MNLQDLAEMDLGTRRNFETVLPETKPNRHFPFLIPVVAFIQNERTWLYLCYDPHRRHELWRYITILLVHFSPVHLLGNLLFELLLGLPLEMAHGGLRTGIIFISGVIGGSLCISVLEPKYYAIGASGGVYALLAGHVVKFLLNWNQMKRKILWLNCLIAYIIFDVAVAVFLPEKNVSHAAHVGGAIGGFIASAFLLGNPDLSRWEKQWKGIVAAAGIVLFLIVLTINITFPAFYLQTELNMDYLQTFLTSPLNDTVPGNPAFWL